MAFKRFVVPGSFMPYHVADAAMVVFAEKLGDGKGPARFVADSPEGGVGPSCMLFEIVGIDEEEREKL